jgi:lipoprotein-releasing system ATP-binding protein
MNKFIPSTSIVLACEDVYKEYQDANTPIKILLGVSLQVERGEQIAIMGRSGSGKTTLLQMLGGLDTPTAGDIWINNRSLRRLNERQREQMRNRSLGFIYQMHHLLPEFTALENVALPLLIQGATPKIAQAEAFELLKSVGLSDRTQHFPSQLSGGERQRVAIARALVNRPECILADEPTGNLDDESAEQVLNVMQSLNRTHETSLIVVTHDIALAQKMDKTYILHGGKLIRE